MQCTLLPRLQYIRTAMNSCVLQGYMWLHSQVGHTYNSRVEVRSAECACGKAMLPVRTIFIHTCSLYENVVNGTKVAWYRVVNTTQLENLAGSKNRLGLGFGLWPLHVCKERCNVWGVTLM